MDKKTSHFIIAAASVFIICLAANLFVYQKISADTSRIADLNIQNTDITRKLEESKARRFNTRGTDLITISPFLDRVAADIQGHAAKDKIAAFVALDGDHIGVLNNTYGNEVITPLILQLALLFKKSFPDKENDILCNVGDGSDEFYFFLENRNSKAEIEQEISSVLDAWRKTDKKSNGITINLTVSAGIAFYPDDGTDVVTLYKKADKALYMSKEGGRDRYTTYKE